MDKILGSDGFLIYKLCTNITVSFPFSCSSPSVAFFGRKFVMQSGMSLALRGT